MTEDDWLRVIDDAVSLGVQMVQFIGGEPTLHPSFPVLVHHALEHGSAVEVFTNLVNVSGALWDVFSLPRVRLATSYYSDQPGQHEAITARRGSHGKTMNNIAEAVRRSIPIRVGLIGVADGQRVDQARRRLEALGVTEVSTDRLRQVGRGVRDQDAGMSQLCGACAHGKVAVAASGDVWPCVFARWMLLGNVRSTPLAEIVGIERMEIAQAALSYQVRDKCSPDSRCDPSKSDCQPNCPPGYHTEPKRCWPYYYEDRKR